MQGLKPAGRHLKIGGEQDVVFGLDLLQRGDVAAGKPAVDGNAQQLYCRKMLLDPGCRIVGGSVIGDDDLVAGSRFRDDEGEEELMPFPAVVAQNDDGGILRAGDKLWQKAMYYLYFGSYVVCSGTFTSSFFWNLCSYRL